MAPKRAKPVTGAVANTMYPLLRELEGRGEPFLDSVIRFVTLVKREIYGAG